MAKIYQEKHLISYANADENGQLKLPALINYLMQTSNHQLSTGGAGIRDFLAKGLGWVVVDYHFDIARLPQAGETVTFSTNGSGYNRFFEYRDFNAYDEDKHEIIKVKSQWVILDLKKRKICSPDPETMAVFDNQELKKMPRFTRLRPLSKYDQEREYRVRYYDLDTNHHLTNSRYFDWMIDMLPRDFLSSYSPKSIDITFKKEVQYGQNAQVKVSLDSKELTSYHEVSHSNDVCALAKIVWQK